MQENRVQERYVQMRKEHFGRREEFPAARCAAAVNDVVGIMVMLMVRFVAKGISTLMQIPRTASALEVDLLMGRWASENVWTLTVDELQQYEDILNRETIDIFNFISGKDAIPEVFISQRVMTHTATPIYAPALCTMSVGGYAYCTISMHGKDMTSYRFADRDTQRAFASQGVLTLRARKSAASTGLLLGAAVGVFFLAYQGLKTTIEQLRGEEDFLNAGAAVAVAGLPFYRTITFRSHMGYAGLLVALDYFHEEMNNFRK
ncbi:hypothetical protein DYB38_001681 [Aphanomyces astaci]|uniref:Uncharacterized protein n=1 Tax=Aphanomyces astaci TaxID=112090 RepID=A0A397DB68_APHAT|nr:hypothetical protein DYB38_001681 [Aphanomyces astaci]